MHSRGVQMAHPLPDPVSRTGAVIHFRANIGANLPVHRE